MFDESSTSLSFFFTIDLKIAFCFRYKVARIYFCVLTCNCELEHFLSTLFKEEFSGFLLLVSFLISLF